MLLLRLFPLVALLLPAAAHAAPAPSQETDLEDVTEGQQDEEESESEEEAETSPVGRLMRGLSFRGIGPSIASGRVGDLVVDPRNPARWILAVSSGGVWITENAGTTFEPVFDGEDSYSIGCLALDPSNPDVVWVGSGENNSQRSVSWGDGVYRSVDGGRSWSNTGLEGSQHIGRIVVDPRDGDVVWVAAQGPLWNEGGERGLYRTTDGGATWERKLHVDEHTGVNEVHLDPRDPDVMYASTYQRARRTWTLLNGGPGSGIHKSTDGGETWRELERGLPSVDMGRIGLAISPADPDVVYAIVEAQRDAGGVFRSTNGGETWSKRSGYMTSSPQYYNELVPHPTDPDTVYALDTFLQVSTDGGATFRRVPGRDRHVDDHALWIDPERPSHMVVGCDGGLYETFDGGEHWRFCANLPVTQFYRLALDDARPFYNVYGGTQDNNTLGGPTRTTDVAGITNADWFVTVGGDGFEPAVDPTDPNIVYSQWQYGGLVRHDRRSGETVDIKPRQAVGETEEVFNWDSPLAISPFSHTRLYFAGRRLYRSEDRGETWRCISGDLSRGLDRDRLEVMGRVWEVDAVAKHRSTSIYGNAVAFSESPLVEDLLYVGSDDGLVHVSSDGGASWTRHESFPGVPELAYVSCLLASRHDPDTVYATFENHKAGDFEPYVLVSRDRGTSWARIDEDLEAPHLAWCLAEDHVVPGLLFLGTEYGVMASLDDGATWHELGKGLPTIAVRDLEIQRRFDDLVLATFGRGFYVLDDYSPLRELVGAPELEGEARLFPTRTALAYHERGRLGGREGRGSQGAGYYNAPNPDFGAVFTYELAESMETLEDARLEAQREARKDETLETPLPTLEELRAERLEMDPALLLVVRDGAGEVLAQVGGRTGKGLHRAAWDLRSPALDPVREGRRQLEPWESPSRGPMVPPGTYTVELVAVEDGRWRALAGPQPFRVEALGQATLQAEDPVAAYEFKRRVEHLRGAVEGAGRSLGEARGRLGQLRRAAAATPAEDGPLLERLRSLELRLEELSRTLEGDGLPAELERPAPVSISARIGNLTWRLRGHSGGPSSDDRAAYDDAAASFGPWLAELRRLVEGELAAIEAQLDAEGAPWTPGRLPVWPR